MRLAIVVDDLIQSGGQEALLSAVSDIFPKAPIYTSIASEKWLNYYKNKGRAVVTSFAQHFPYAQNLSRYYVPFLVHNLAYESFDLSNYDVVFSMSSRFAHTVITKPSTTHISYINSPGRMFWEHKDYFKTESFGKLNGLQRLGHWFIEIPLSILRLLDYAGAQRVDVLVANSASIALKIAKYYNRTAEVIYPYVDAEKYINLPIENGGYYLLISRLTSWKKVDIAIEACKALNLKLKIVGEGSDFDRLHELIKRLGAGNDIELLGRVSEPQKQELLSQCTALLHPQYEDFGIVPLEAMATGKPVLAFGAGGAPETVVAGQTGEFFTEQTKESLIEALKSFFPSQYLPRDCREQALKFDKPIFISRIKQLVEQYQ